MTDAAAQERAHAIFDPIAAEYLARPGVDIGPMFGSEGLRIRGKVFAFVGYRGSLVVKVPADRADELASAGTGERMQTRGRTMREWVLVGPDRADAWAPLIADAFAFVDEITP
ncbi:MmcQ/YjbR family DNA-binding protein [Microbacterium timonense]|uniref:MmcQ/YjbR family DNA-binding protein n=1 Tax=Microbacterium timonense TaxID=2086576 RepID=UPI000D1074B4|nr:MmcQ/YjbR family DNA-binding protein [Microbacterium timonense]